MPSTLDSDGELALLLGGKTGFGNWFNPTIGIDIAAKSFGIAIIEV
jgi:hypothetical protein